MLSKQINFEKSLARLQEIVDKIEKETLPLEESLKLYEQFNKVYNLIDDELQKNGQLTIDVILLDNNPSDVLNIISNYSLISLVLILLKQG